MAGLTTALPIIIPLLQPLDVFGRDKPTMKHEQTDLPARCLINPGLDCVPIVKITISSEGRERKGACQGLLRFSVLFNVGDDIKV